MAQHGSHGLSRDLQVVSGDEIKLRIQHLMLMIDGKASHGVGISGSVPAPVIRLREGQEVVLRVVNELDEETSLYCHGLLVPTQSDCIPGVSFPGVPARSTFE